MFEAFLHRLRTLRPTRAASGRAQQLQHDAERLHAILSKSDCAPNAEQLASTLNRHLDNETQRVLQATHSALQDRSTPIRVGLQKRLGFVPLVQASLVKGAGNGLFIRGEVRAGRLLALFPGLFFNMSEVAWQLSDLAIARYDGVVIDSAHSISINVASSAEETAHEQVQHPFANAHYANHGVPNALQFMIDVSRSSAPRHIYDLVPVRAAPKQRSMLRVLEGWADIALMQRVPGAQLYAKQGSHVVKTVGLIALRDIQDGEEIRFNYRFNPESKALPQWYTDPEPEISKRRWQQAPLVW